jgi:hypothetical protein
MVCLKWAFGKFSVEVQQGGPLKMGDVSQFGDAAFFDVPVVSLLRSL